MKKDSKLDLINIEAIRNILTLRYDPHGPTFLPKLSWENFIEYNGVAQFVPTLLEGVVKRMVQTDAPRKIGIGISGGVDSTTVLCILRKCFPKQEINTFCITFGEDDKEAKDAEYVAEIYSTNHKHIVIENPLADLEEQIRIVNEPRWNLYPYYLFAEASKDCDLLFTGDGGDELFGGYVFRYQYVLQQKTEPLVKRYLEAHNRDWVDDQKELFKFPFDWNGIYNLLNLYFDNPLPVLGKTFLADYNGKLLYDFSRTNNAFSRHFHLKMAAPMLEPEILHISTHIPYNLKYDVKNNIGKLILRQILLENSGYKPATKAKIGWGMNTVWMWDKHAREMCMELFDSARLIELGIINKNWIPKGMRKADEHDPRYINKMLGLLALEIWLKVKGL
ncbi:asparagine synthase [Candidatus Bathyarchaeota archaeon]|nr:asparagine synthase [Candidatus Bathyarchaeota archaeon]